MGPWGVNLVSLLRGQNLLRSLLLYISFDWQTGAELCQREGMGLGQGEALAPWKQGKAHRAPFSVYAERGLA